MNDVLADLHAILSPSGLSPSEIDAGLAPALCQYRETEFTPVLPGGGLVTLANKVGPEDEYVEPNAGKVFRFDHLTGVGIPSPSPCTLDCTRRPHGVTDLPYARSLAPPQKPAPATSGSDDYTSPYSAETESARSALDKLLNTHVSNHYTDGVAAVYVLPDPAYPPPPPADHASTVPATSANEETPSEAVSAATTTEAAAEEALAKDLEGSASDVADTAAETAEVVTEVLEYETVETVSVEVEEQRAAAAPSDNGNVGSEPAPLNADEPSLEEGESGAAAPIAADAEEDKMDIASPQPDPAPEAAAVAAASSSTTEEQVEVPETAAPRPSNRFGLYFVGHKYSPNNYWCVYRGRTYHDPLLPTRIERERC